MNHKLQFVMTDQFQLWTSQINWKWISQMLAAGANFGQTIDFRTSQVKLQSLWKLSNPQITDLGNEFFLVNFDSDEEYESALLEGPWTILGSYHLVQPWSPSFNINCDNIDTAALWIHLPKLPMHLYHEKMIRKISSAVGRIIKIDNSTRDTLGGQYVRVIISVDLRKPLVSKVQVKNSTQIIEYESLPSVCYSYGWAGHQSSECLFNSSSFGTLLTNTEAVRTAPPTPEQNYGEWMLVTKKGRQFFNRKGVDSGKSNILGSRFDALREENMESLNMENTMRKTLSKTLMLLGQTMLPSAKEKHQRFSLMQGKRWHVDCIVLWKGHLRWPCMQNPLILAKPLKILFLKEERSWSIKRKILLMWNVLHRQQTCPCIQ